MKFPSIFPFGESALVCESPAPATLACQKRIWTIAEVARQWPHVTEVVPGMNNLTVLFDPLATNVDVLTQKLAKAWGAVDTKLKPGRLVEIPVCYGGEYGPDLATVAHHTALSAEAVIKLHASTEYTVFCLGFQPGFAYLGGLDPKLETPRRAEPRVAIPAGSVGIGGAQTGIYPASSPGGWQLIGHTREKLFDPMRTPPSLLQPGDRVRFTIASLTTTTI
ncbi:5-oxoprolinase subunit PxpB [Mycoavidus sp. HKI]|uniref:5-oxoprolinase subunit PxpB n=1 Tax=Mycoavidus sp. HKI TaxID=2840467 RepID=UPI001CBF5F0A|nr:5-oxoprolinase subunit PxpB [Mycoavidus sp. HKI]UAW64200.1 5-oxoprolinase subunit PxpB [Mycoavidus sp. HKI]